MLRETQEAPSVRSERTRGTAPQRIVVRWTIGDVSSRGFEALRLSVAGAYCVFGPAAKYVVFVNSVPVERVATCLRALPARIWHAVAIHDASGMLPDWLAARFSDGLAGGMGWKLAPVRAFPEHYELALDNDVILWRLPPAVSEWLECGGVSRALVAGDVKACYGRFAELAGDAPVNLGIRGLPPGLDFEGALRRVLNDTGLDVVDPDDEQGLQVAALRRSGEPFVISATDVTICSPFPPHVPALGACGAHFVGINSHLPWFYYERPADEVRSEHWESHVDEIRRRLQLP